MASVAVLPPLHKNPPSSRRDLEVNASAGIPKPKLLKKGNINPNRSTTEFDKPEYLSQQWVYLTQQINEMREAVDPLQQESDDLQTRCERMNYTPEMTEIAAKTDEARQTKRELDDELATIRRTFTEAIQKELSKEISELKGKFHFNLDHLTVKEEELDDKKNELYEIYESDTRSEIDSSREKITELRKRLSELRKEGAELDDDLELKLNDLAADPTENPKITHLKKRLAAAQHENNRRRNTLNKMRKEFEAKRSDILEKKEKNKQQKQKRERSKNWRQNLNIPEKKEEELDESENDQTYDFAQLSEQNKQQKPKRKFNKNNNRLFNNLFESKPKQQPQQEDIHISDDLSEADQSDENYNDDNQNDFNDEKEEAQEEIQEDMQEEVKEPLSGVINGSIYVSLQRFVQLDVEPTLDFDYSMTGDFTSSIDINNMSKSGPAGFQDSALIQPPSDKASTTRFNRVKGHLVSNDDDEYDNDDVKDIDDEEKIIKEEEIKDDQEYDTKDAIFEENLEAQFKSDEVLQHIEAVKIAQEIATGAAELDEMIENEYKKIEATKNEEDEILKEYRKEEKLELINNPPSDSEKYRRSDKEQSEILLSDNFSDILDSTEMKSEDKGDSLLIKTHKEEEEKKEDKEEGEKNVEDKEGNEEKTENGEEDDEKEKELSRARFGSVVADIQPCSLFLKLAEEIEKNGDINIDELLSQM